MWSGRGATLCPLLFLRAMETCLNYKERVELLCILLIIVDGVVQVCILFPLAVETL